MFGRLRIFISHANEDVAMFERLAARLEEHGYDVFRPGELPEGEAYDARIADAIKASVVFVFLASRASVFPTDSGRVRYALAELTQARRLLSKDGSRKLIRVLLEDIPREALPDSLQAVTIRKADGDPTAQVLLAVTEFMAKRRQRRLRLSRALLGVAFLITASMALAAYFWKPGYWLHLATVRSTIRDVTARSPTRLGQEEFCASYMVWFQRFDRGVLLIPTSIPLKHDAAGLLNKAFVLHEPADARADFRRWYMVPGRFGAVNASEYADLLSRASQGPAPPLVLDKAPPIGPSSEVFLPQAPEYVGRRRFDRSRDQPFLTGGFANIYARHGLQRYLGRPMWPQGRWLMVGCRFERGIVFGGLPATDGANDFFGSGQYLLTVDDKSGSSGPVRGTWERTLAFPLGGELFHDFNALPTELIWWHALFWCHGCP